MVSLVVGAIFYGQTLTQDGVMNINGAIFLFLTNMTFQNVFSVANVSEMEIRTFIRLVYLRAAFISGLLCRVAGVSTRNS